ncbi:RTA1 like protein-domain-containing protein [Hygrophoropsis aurantiaca]|uniref:RTA1 like protein-domain-containing protein n=1 Tax=Hygrophoropsis aurantiaca TaxID=72124 RepID=A0ACB8A808_9AGAM|nr:RTA1 like protein-domain-containing protein [Hygrophoropsis aurantiaca]
MNATTFPQPTIVSVVFRYNPSKIVAGVAGGLYVIASALLFTRLFANRTWWGLCLPIASTCMALGFYLRIPMALNPNSLPIFMLQQLLAILPPAAYLAFNYILYGRFVVGLASRSHGGIAESWGDAWKRYSWIRSEKVARWFVASDVTTFLIQGAGGGMQASTNVTSDKLGADILLGGLVLQTLSFALFILLVVRAWRSIVRDGVRPAKERWGVVLWTLFFSSTFFMIRCIYRVIELAQGNGGYLMTHEVYFYVLDSLPLLIGISTYVIFWPSKYLASLEAEAKSPADAYAIPMRP